jgi:hypothetical protein
MQPPFPYQPGMSGQAAPAQYILLVYRPGDVDETAGRVYDRLLARYGPALVLRDLFGQANELPPEPAARAYLESRMEQVAAVVVVIGPHWLEGISRPNDIVYAQVAAAMRRRRLPVIPTLAESTLMPAAIRLPPDIEQFTLFNAASARLDPDFDADMARLLDALAREAPNAPTTPAPAPGTPARRTHRAQWLFRSPLRIASTTLISLSLIFLLIAAILTPKAKGAGTPLTQSAPPATPVPAATDLPTPFPAGYYAASLTNGASGWTQGSQCVAKSDGLHIANSLNGCAAPDAAQAGDGDLSVVAKQISGPLNRSYGLFFREDILGGYYLYSFLITSNGYWVMLKEVNRVYSNVTSWQPAAAIHTGLNMNNRIEVRFKGSQFTFLINGQQIGFVTDSSVLAQGTFDDPIPDTGDGLFGSTEIEVVFTTYLLRPIR